LDSARIIETMKSSREILKRVDQLVKANDLEKALHEVRKARELDPKIYMHLLTKNAFKSFSLSGSGKKY